MSDGHIVATGTPAEIFANDELLNQVGLRQPRTIALAKKLREMGFDVDGCQDAETLGGRVCQLLRKI